PDVEVDRRRLGAHPERVADAHRRHVVVGGELSRGRALGGRRRADLLVEAHALSAYSFSSMPRTLAARGAAVLLLTTSAKLLACSRDTEVDALPPSALSDRPIALTPRFSGPRFAGCVYASPLAFEEREGG